jgi:glycoside/pentoside/hexuronide:cation symporter, GPH family
MMPHFGYENALAIQPTTVDTGFKLFMSVPSVISCGLVILSLALYPLYGKRLKEVKQQLAEKQNLKT